MSGTLSLSPAALSPRAGIPQVPTFLALDTRGRLVGVVVGLSPGLGPALERLLRLAEGKAGQPE